MANLPAQQNNAIEIKGPYNPTGISNSITRPMIFVCDPKVKGETLALVSAGYAVIRFVVEFWRGDAERGLLQPMLVRPLTRRAVLVGRFLAAAACGGKRIRYDAGAFSILLPRKLLVEQFQNSQQTVYSLRLGVDGIVTDFPGRMARWLADGRRD